MSDERTVNCTNCRHAYEDHEAVDWDELERGQWRLCECPSFHPPVFAGAAATRETGAQQ